MQFMSRRLLKEWSTRPLRTAIDDLESFSWILLWIALHLSNRRTDLENDWLSSLSSDDIKTVAHCKSEILYSATADEFDNLEAFSSYLSTVIPLLRGWWKVASDAGKALRKLIDRHSSGKQGVDDVLHDDALRGGFYKELEELCLSYYVRYIKLGTEFLEKEKFYGRLSSPPRSRLFSTEISRRN